MSLTDEVLGSWEAIERVLARDAPACASTLGGPATEQQIQLLERTLALTLPDDLAASLRRHNGQVDPEGLFDFSGAGTLLSTESIVQAWRVPTETERDAVARARTDSRASWWRRILRLSGVSGPEISWWKPSLVPFTELDGGMLCIDVDREMPVPGEVVWHWVDGEIERGVARSYATWLAELAHRLQNGGLRVNEFGQPQLE